MFLLTLVLSNLPLVLLLALLTIVLLYLTRDKKANLLHIPGPAPLPILGNALLFAGPMENYLPTMASLWAKYGSIFRIHFGTTPQLVISAPEHFEKILSSSVHLTKGFQYHLMSPWLGDSLAITSPNK